ncbi:Protein SEED AND ROOT HAIR PROTECTIVE PROTEIN [Linum perenne]
MAAIIHFILGTYVLLLSLILAATASGDYYPVSSDSKPTVTKPEESKNENPNKNSPKPTDAYRPNTQEKPNIDLPNLPKPEPIKPQITGYGPKPNYDLTKPKLNIPKLEDAFPSAVEGTVVCRSGSSYVPIQGAMVRITCWGVDEEGYEINTLSCQSGPTDAKGYFFEMLPSSNYNKNISGNCKAFMEQSPLENCSVPSDVNRGMTGSLLSTYHLLHDKSLKLYSIGPFFYTSDVKSSAATTSRGY